MTPPPIFLIGAPRSGTTMLERILGSHPDVLGGPEPHLMTPLAHLGVWDKVDKAPYDHVLAAEAQRRFVAELPGGEQDYWDACRAYADTLYGRRLAASGRTRLLDKTPAYALVLPFLRRVYPDAAYVVLTRHPAAIFASYAESFFAGDYAAAHAYNPILERYVPAIAAFLREPPAMCAHVRYEDLVHDPETHIRRICETIGLGFDPGMVAYGERRGDRSAEGAGDPTGVHTQTRPGTASLSKWVDELRADPAGERLVRGMLDRIAPEDLAAFGYPPETLWEAYEAAGPKTPRARRARWTRYRLQRWLIVRLRARAQRGGVFRRALQRLRLACDVLLRE